MGLKRIGAVTPAANTPTNLFVAESHYLTSVIASNKTASAQLISVWVEPSGATEDSDYVYIVNNFPVDGNNAYETFRFAVNPTDTIRVKSGSASTSFSAYGIVQVDVNVKFGTATYTPSEPVDPFPGMIWVDSDGISPNNGTAKPTYVWSGSQWIPMSAAAPTAEPAHTDIILAQRMFG